MSPKNTPKKNDILWMARALALAVRGKGKTSPNPMVGAVVVKNDRVISEGFHTGAGKPHAEITALCKAAARAKGAALYVTLEPCSTHGRTPPCVGTVIASGVRRVVFAAADPNPKNKNKAAAIFKRHGILCNGGVLAAESRQLNRTFETWMRQRRPYVTLKLGQSIDGKIATVTGQSRWITSEASRKKVHEIRSYVDAILVGITTVLQDNPRLDARGASKKPLIKVILDSQLRIQPSAHVFASPGKTWIFVSTTVSKTKIASFSKKIEGKGEVVVVPSANGKLNLQAVLKELAKRQILHLLVEGGGEVAASFLEAKLVDEAYFFIAPILIGGKSAPTSVEGKGIASLARSIKLDRMTVERFDTDVLLHGYIH